MIYSFLELLTFFSLTLVDLYSLAFTFRHIKKILYVNTKPKGNQSRNKNKSIYIFTCFSYWCWKILFFDVELKIFINNFQFFSVSTRRFYLAWGVTNLYSFIRGSLKWPFSELFLSDASLWNQYKFIAFNIFSYNISIIYSKILIITVTSNETTN